MRSVAILALLATLQVSLAEAADLPSPERALKQYLPIHKDVEIDRPTAAEAANCKIYAKKISGVTAVFWYRFPFTIRTGKSSRKGSSETR